MKLWTEIFFREFSNERTRVERRETFRKLRMRENFSKAFEGYFQWISKAGNVFCQYFLSCFIIDEAFGFHLAKYARVEPCLNSVNCFFENFCQCENFL